MKLEFFFFTLVFMYINIKELIIQRYKRDHKHYSAYIKILIYFVTYGRHINYAF